MRARGRQLCWPMPPLRAVDLTGGCSRPRSDVTGCSPTRGRVLRAAAVPFLGSTVGQRSGGLTAPWTDQGAAVARWNAIVDPIPDPIPDRGSRHSDPLLFNLPYYSGDRTSSAQRATTRPQARHRSKMAFASPPVLTTPRTARVQLCSSAFAGSSLRVVPAVRRASLAAHAVPNVRMSAGERSFIAIKPDGVSRGLVGSIISRFEARGFKLVAMKAVVPSKELAETHYASLSTKLFFADLVQFITSGPVVAMVWEGKEVVATARKMIGQTNPLSSDPGTIRGDFAVDVGRNVIHGSDTEPGSAQREIGIWFTDSELCDWAPTQNVWIYE